MLLVMNVIFNGQLLSSSDPRVQVSPFSNAIEFGQSVFETFRTYNGVLPANLKSHWERLFQSASLLAIQVPNGLNQATLDASVQQLLNALDLDQDYRLKVLLNQDFWWLKAIPLVPVAPEVYEAGVVVDDQIEQRDLCRAKWVSPLYPLYQAYSSQYEVFETLYFSTDDYLLEGSVSNVIAVIRGGLITPMEGVLPGITVRSVLEYASKEGLKVNFTDISRHELKTASEIFLTNAIKGLVPVRSWGKWERAHDEIYQQIKGYRGD